MPNKLAGNEVLVKYIKFSGISMNGLAERAGISRQSIWNHVTGKYGIGLHAARKYSKASGIDVAKFIKL